jgi:hypothetical protein
VKKGFYSCWPFKAPINIRDGKVKGGNGKKEDEDVDENGNGRKKGSQEAASYIIDIMPSREYVCPFYEYNPLNHSNTRSYTKGYNNYHRLK